MMVLSVLAGSGLQSAHGPRPRVAGPWGDDQNEGTQLNLGGH